ncbi:hypothetical protein PR003_g1171 [Phytophthora rubi]|uniref:PiggyBac transposable element-derived protein domain-containing protein n=1 Tax=Phytophthora rubi TaxID=129364 RepID=A0A6A4G4Y1_9STRA|nr:hypothetical protein PR002_g1144 [Phytophthora rubi]KAE9051958.1 hypothetical protein PR001_g949 [Phytophthora rubi]KAE9358628.1 hypothetical protein PR003_g1171 [Phytophthora rubi]
MTVGDDPLALLFYSMPPRLWTQIAIESNRYHAQSIPLRARAIRSQQRRAGLQVEDLADIRSRLARVPDIEPWEVLRVMGLLIARMLMPIRKGIAAHWSMKQVGALPTNRFNLFMTKHRFFSYYGLSTLLEQQLAKRKRRSCVEDPAGRGCVAADLRSWKPRAPRD